MQTMSAYGGTLCREVAHSPALLCGHTELCNRYTVL